MNKLELNWIGKHDKESQVNPEPRILIENKEYSYGLDSDNMLIHGDNLLALKSLQQEYAGKVKCIYIDPPYNTGSAFEHYDDNLEHSTWLNLMKPRLELLKKLLADNGSIWISIDADESHYLKVLCDEVLGRKNFVNEIVWQRAFAPVNLKKTLSRSHDTILVYAKNYDSRFELNKLSRSDSQLKNYKNPDYDTRGMWTSSDCTVGPIVKEKLYPITTPSGKKVTPPDGRCWLFTKERFQEMIDDNRIWFGESGNNAPRVKKFLSEVKEGVVAMTMWLRDEVGDNQEAKREIKQLNSSNVFATPKPERLLQRILTLATNKGDLVLDSFLGSGTTAAVAHKMNRRFIGIELGDHAYTHCHSRLKSVVDGEQGGISKAINWQGGGGFKFYELAPSLLEKSRFGNLVVSDKYNAEMLAQAMAKHEGYTYSPNENTVWKQGFSDAKNYIFTTSGYVSSEFLDNIASELTKDEYLLICAESFDADCANRHKNIIVRPIPKMLLGRCQWGKDNYDLNIILQDVDDWSEEDE